MASANISITLEVKVVTHEDGESHRVEVGGTPATAWLTDAGVLALRDALHDVAREWKLDVEERIEEPTP